MDYYQQIPFHQFPQQEPAVDYRQQGQFFPGGGGGFNQQINRLERQIERLDRRMDQLERRIDRIERRLGFRPDVYHQEGY
ncbi:hypothetical protein [Bacillus benzoevorans]|uniref:Uncharacterized protein n=1 Tax=Bacillus benzoevorans TaxID=1456 RepID=A0A7X0HRV6_9BACI|nr:hypothetical protein [Bacillus benzoevorans]MBB6445759.1 hypothetical protein [Bacillus benzoevorans]